MKDQVTNADILEAINNFRDEMRRDYVSKDSYEPVKKLVYGMVSVILLAVMGALVTLVVRTQ